MDDFKVGDVVLVMIHNSPFIGKILSIPKEELRIWKYLVSFRGGASLGYCYGDEMQKATLLMELIYG